MIANCLLGCPLVCCCCFFVLERYPELSIEYILKLSGKLRVFVHAHYRLSEVEYHAD